jgi:hypothetical protein
MSPKEFYDRVKELTKDTEMFLHESPYNNYQPKPPEGFFALRSHKRRLFIKGTYGPHVQNLIEQKEYIEISL